MYIARILYPVEVLGIGKRIGIWFCGCPHECDGCSNPELWKFNNRYHIGFENLCFLIKSLVETNQVDGFTITGGEPFYQSEGLLKLLKFLRKYTDDILVYTGYTYSELKCIPNSDEILENIGVLIDGRYIKSQNKCNVLKGSENQKIYYLKKSLEKDYEKYIKENQSRIQNFTIGKEVISVGIHKPDYEELLRQKLLKLGFEKGCDEDI